MQTDLILNGVELEILPWAQKIMSISSIRQDRISRRHTGSDILPSQLQILKTAAELREKGIETETRPVDEFSGGNYLFKDPDGLPLSCMNN